MKITTFIFEIIREIIDSESFTEKFKQFAKDLYPIIQLCHIFEEGTGKKINKENINIVINFIEKSIPLLNEIGKKIHNFDDEMLGKLILKFYVPARESYLKEVH